MATGVYTDFQIYQDEYYTAMNETLQQETEAFNAASANAIRLVADQHEGHFRKEAFFKQISSLIARRDISSTADDADAKLESGEKISVKVNRKYQVANTLDSLRKIASDQEEFSILLGEQVAKAKAADYLNTALIAAKVNLINNSGVYVNKTSDTSPNMEYQYLIDMLAKFGDAGKDIVAWVMHSGPFYHLMGESLSTVIDRVAGATIYEGTVGTLGKPVVVTDSSALVNSDGGSSPDTDAYYTFGLTTDGLFVIESEEDTVVTDTVTGKENLIIRIQGEHAFDVGVRGYSYDGGTINPTDANLGNSSNWSKVASDDKLTAGVACQSG